MLTGEKPYTGEHLTTVVYKIVTEEPPPPHRLNPSLSGPIDTVMRKALAKKPDARYANCQEFVGLAGEGCAATKGWKLMPRGGSLNEPTMADTAGPRSVALPRGVKPIASRRHHGNRRSARLSRKGGFLKFLAAALVDGSAHCPGRLAGAVVAFFYRQAAAGGETKPPTPPKPAELPPRRQPKQTPRHRRRRRPPTQSRARLRLRLRPSRKTAPPRPRLAARKPSRSSRSSSSAAREARRRYWTIVPTRCAPPRVRWTPRRDAT